MDVARKFERRPGSEEDSVSVSCERPLRAWAGRGRGTRCDHCRQPIAPEQIEYEVEMPLDHLLQTISLHLGCYEEWILAHQPCAQRDAAL